MPEMQPNPPAAPFEEDAARVLTRLRSELAGVIAAIPTDVTKGADLHRALRVDRKLSYQVYKVARSIDPVAAGPHVPSRTNLRTFLQAALKRGVPKKLIESASQAADELEAIVGRHAGDRATFDSMISSLSPDETKEQIDLAHRRTAFRGERHIFGLRARAKVKFIAIQPSPDPKRLDAAGVQGVVSLRRLRSDASLQVSASCMTDDKGVPCPIRREAIDPEGATDGMALLREFCSSPLPEFRLVDIGSGFVGCQLINPGLGKCAAVDCLEGHVGRGVIPRYKDKANNVGHYLAEVGIPTEVLLFDLLVHEDTYSDFKPRLVVYGEMLATTTKLVKHCSIILPHNTTLAYLGKGPSVLYAPEMPRYTEMGNYVFERLGWEGERFDVYRCRIEYPVLHSTAIISFDLPENPLQPTQFLHSGMK